MIMVMMMMMMTMMMIDDDDAADDDYDDDSNNNDYSSIRIDTFRVKGLKNEYCKRLPRVYQCTQLMVYQMFNTKMTTYC